MISRSQPIARSHTVHVAMVTVLIDTSVRIAMIVRIAMNVQIDRIARTGMSVQTATIAQTGTTTPIETITQIESAEWTMRRTNTKRI